MANFTGGVLTVILVLAVYHLVSGKKPTESETESLKSEALKEQFDFPLKKDSNDKATKATEKEEYYKTLQKILTKVVKQSKDSRAANDGNSMKEIPDCHMNITVEGSGQGFLHSPFYPSNYPNDLHCVYHITTKPGYVTQLNFVDFNVESGTGCAYDWLQVFAHFGVELIALSEKHCGKQPPMLDLIEHNSVLIEFQTDFSQTAPGFSAFYRIFKPNELCMFGPEEDCAFPCHCVNDDICNRDDGTCTCKDEPPHDDFVGDQWEGIGCQTGNIALHKPANQSGTGLHIVPGSADNHAMPASQATDGYTGQRDWGQHCAWVVNQDNNTRAWWVVDLGDLYQVATVVVFNTDQKDKYETLGYISLKHSQGTTDINIMQGCNGKMSPIPMGESFFMQCPVVARYIGIERIVHPDAIDAHTMALCEVKVIGHKYYNVDCSINGTCEGSCYPGLYCDECKQGYKKPECTEMESEATNCGMPVVPEHGLVSYNDTWSGSVANYSCEEGFTVQGSQSVVCSVEGEWLNHPNCTRINCGAPPLDDSAESLDYSGTLYEDTVTYRCAEGYKLLGQAEIHCTANGTWDHPAPKCQLMACGPPPDVENAYLSGITGNVVHSVATYTCEEGYLPNGKMELKCNTDVQWTSDDLLPQCTGVPCKSPPPAPEKGFVAFSNGTVYTSVVEYQCEDNYYFMGIEGNCFLSTCTKAGIWSKMPPKCLMECGGVLTEPTGVIISPNWPEYYDNNRLCTWLIKAPRPGDQIVLRFTDFEIEHAHNCTYDHINLYDSNGLVEVLIDTYCGDELPPTIYTVGNYLLLEFFSDPAEELKGFRAEYATVKAESMTDVSTALELFYPELVMETLVESNLTVISEAVTYLKSYMLTMEDSFQYAECLFLLEAEDGIENILYYHSVPRLKQYLYNTFDRAIYHIPRNYHTAQVIMDLIEGDNLTRVYNKLTDPLVALQRNIQYILGLESFQAEPVLFSTIEAPVLDKMVEHRDRPSSEIVMFLVDFLHNFVLGDPQFHFKINMLNCPPVDDAAVSLVHALENATQSLAMVMGSLPNIIDAAFGPGAVDIVEVYKQQLIEQLHILQHPFHVLIGVRNLVLQTFTLQEDIGEPNKNYSVESPGIDVEKYMTSSEPITAKWLSYTIEENLKISKLSFIKKDIEHFLLMAVPDAYNQSIEDISLIAFELMTQAFHERIVTDMPSYCLDAKLTAMLVGFLEIHLVDIAMSDLNISTVARSIANILVTENVDVQQNALESTIASRLRAQLFNMFRGRLLQLDKKIEEITHGPVSTETLPMDIAVIIISEQPKTLGEMISKVIEVTVPALMVNVSCKGINWTTVDHIMMDFLDGFNDLTLEVIQAYEDLNLTQSNIEADTAQKIKALVTSGLYNAKDHLLHSFTQLHLVKDNEEDKTELEKFFIENLALALYNIVQMLQPNKSLPHVKVDELMEVIEWQHISFQELIVQYMQGLVKLLDELKDEHFNPCEEYPHICKLGLLESLTTKRKKCASCDEN